MKALLGSALIGLMLNACGGGGSGNDISPDDPPVSTATGTDKFLLFPNPQVQPDGSLQTNAQAYSQAYYAAIDPANAKDPVLALVPEARRATLVAAKVPGKPGALR